MTKDLALLVGPDQKWLSTLGFLDAIDANLKGSHGRLIDGAGRVYPARLSSPVASTRATCRSRWSLPTRLHGTPTERAGRVSCGLLRTAQSLGLSTARSVQATRLPGRRPSRDEPVGPPWQHQRLSAPSSFLRALASQRCSPISTTGPSISMSTSMVEADLGPLFDADLQGNPVGATQCVLTVTAALNNGRTFTGGRWTPTDQYFEQELGLVTREQELGYIQSGGQLLDLVQLRAIQYADRLGLGGDNDGTGRPSSISARPTRCWPASHADARAERIALRARCESMEPMCPPSWSR